MYCLVGLIQPSLCHDIYVHALQDSEKIFMVMIDWYYTLLA